MSKPAFDPNKPYEVVETGGKNKPPFDPSKPYEVVDTKPNKQTSTELESTIRGAGQGATFGFSDELIGGLRALWATDRQDSLVDTYKKMRNEERAKNDIAKRENPKAYLAGEVGGTIVTTAIPGLREVKGAKVLYNAGKAAIQGGLTGAGLSDEDVTTYEGAQNIIGDVAAGAALGAGGSVALNKVGQAVGKLDPKKLKAFGEKKAVQAAGAMTKEMRELDNKHKLHAIGRDLLDKKIVTAFDSLEAISEKAGNIKREAGQKIGDVIDKVDDVINSGKELIDSGKMFSFLPEIKGKLEKARIPTREEAKEALQETFGFSFENIGKRIDNELIQPNLMPVKEQFGGGVAYNPAIRGELEKLAQMSAEFKQLSASTMKGGTGFKKLKGQLTNFDSNSTIPNSFKQDVYRIIKVELEDAVEKSGNLEKIVLANTKLDDVIEHNLKNVPEDVKQSLLSDVYKAAKKDYGMAVEVEEMANKSLGRTSANRTVSLTDTIAGVGGLAAGGPAAGIALGALNKAARKYGDSVMAVGADRLADILQKTPEALQKFMPTLVKAAEKSPLALMTVHAALMKDPDYQRILNYEQQKSGLQIPQKQGLNLPQNNNGLQLPRSK